MSPLNFYGRISSGLLTVVLLALCATTPATNAQGTEPKRMHWKLDPIASPPLELALALYKETLYEGAADTLFTLKRKQVFRFNFASGALFEMTLEGVRPDSCPALRFYYSNDRELVSQNFRDTMQVNSRGELPFPYEQVSVVIEIRAKQKTQTKFRAFLAAYPLFPDSIVLIRKNLSPKP